MTLRHHQIAEALGDLEAVFLDPGSFGDSSVADAATSLASEFVGGYRDDEIVRRLDELVAAEDVGNLKLAGRHLRAVRRKLADRWSITPVTSEPLIPDAEAKQTAASGGRGTAKVQVAARRSHPVSPRRSRTGVGAR